MNVSQRKNRNRFIEFFETGSKLDSGCDRIGMELEHFIIDRVTGMSVSYYGERGIEAILKKLSEHYDSEIISDGHIIGLRRATETISLEPGAQIEVSIIPEVSLRRIEEIYLAFLRLLKNITEPWDYEIVYSGYRPKDKVDDIPLIPKNRYRNMDNHFQKTGTRGRNMMRGTGSIQISIDYRDEEDFKKKFRVASFLSPALALMADNAATFEGEEYNGNTLRQYIWQNVDKQRAEIPYVIDDADFGFRKYADYVSNVPLVAPSDYDDSYTEKTADEIYACDEIGEDEIAHVASMVFPDVRLITYIEIRVGDSMPIEYSISYAAVIKGIFLNEEWVESEYELLAGLGREDIKKAKNEIINKGYEAVIYGRPVSEILDKMCRQAAVALAADEKPYLQKMTELVDERKTLAQKSRNQERG